MSADALHLARLPGVPSAALPTAESTDAVQLLRGSGVLGYGRLKVIAANSATEVHVRLYEGKDSATALPVADWDITSGVADGAWFSKDWGGFENGRDFRSLWYTAWSIGGAATVEFHPTARTDVQVLVADDVTTALT